MCRLNLSLAPVVRFVCTCMGSQMLFINSSVGGKHWWRNVHVWECFLYKHGNRSLVCQCQMLLGRIMSWEYVIRVSFRVAEGNFSVLYTCLCFWLYYRYTSLKSCSIRGTDWKYLCTWTHGAVPVQVDEWLVLLSSCCLSKYHFLCGPHPCIGRQANLATHTFGLFDD